MQNGVSSSETSASGRARRTFLRSMGASFGVAIFGAIFGNQLVGNLASHLHGVSLPAGFSAADATPALLKHLPAVVHEGFVAGYAESIQTVFLVAVPIAALAFLFSWLIPQVELRQWPQAAPQPDAAAAAAVNGSAVNGATVNGAAAPQAPASGPARPSVPMESLDPQDASRLDP